MTPQQIKWSLFIIPALVIGGFETLRHTLFANFIPLELGNWITALIAALVIALISRQLFQRFEKTQRDLSREREWCAVLEERERLARDMHDHIAQSIFYTGVQVQSVQTNTEKYKDQDIQHALNDILASLREVDGSIRQAIFNLKHTPLDSTNFFERVRSYLTEKFGEKGIRWTGKLDTEGPSLEPAEQVHLFGILQEAVTNIIKHSRASSVTVTFMETPASQGKWTFQIEDNGIGFDPQSIAGNRFGLDIILSRAKDIGAQACVESSAEMRRTCISVSKL